MANKPQQASEASQPSRRGFVGAAVLAGAAIVTGGAADLAAPAAPAGLWSASYWATKRRDNQDIRLAVYRKRAGAPTPGEAARPVMLLVHGSSEHALGRDDAARQRYAEAAALVVDASPGRPEITEARQLSPAHR